jgi:NAD(P)H-nitrite reductase large subunit
VALDENDTSQKELGMKSRSEVVIVGASAAGLAVAESLRQRGYRDRVTLVGAEVHTPYDRPPLSKQVLSGEWTPERSQLSTGVALSELGVKLALGQPAIALEANTRTVYTAERHYVADFVIVATGASPRTLPGQSEIAGVHVLRTIDDAVALRKELLSAGRVVVVGDGALGTEIAATAVGLGAHTTVVGTQRLPMLKHLGDTAAQVLADVHREAGVTMLGQAPVTGLVAQDGVVTAVELSTGEQLPADIVVVAAGATPTTQWLESSGLELCDGVVCDSRSAAVQNVYAVGDVARFYHQDLGRWVRLENRTNATEQAVVVAQNVLGADTAYRPVPYFWTDQYAHRIQVHGNADAASEFAIVDGSVAERRFVGCWQHDGQIIGVLGWNMAKQARVRRQQMVSEQSTTM